MWSGDWRVKDEGVDEGQVHGGITEHRGDHTPLANVRLVSKEKMQPEDMVKFEASDKGILDTQT